MSQQYAVIKSQTELEVEEFFGAKGIDDWNKETWEKEINANDVSLVWFGILICMIPGMLVYYFASTLI